MSRFDVYARPGRTGVGYVIDVQADALTIFPSRVVVPLIHHAEAPKPFRGLNPVFMIAGQSYLMLTQAIGTVPTKELRSPVLSLDDRSDDIMRALDFLLVGY
ncbi:MAG: CcdB family protein [Pseudomonadota bacterium]|nr:CcdB family protein [Pseudomonadota bacterium]